MTTSSPSLPPLSLDRLGVRYGKKQALDEVSLAVEKGAVYALLGRNGAGKSSAVRCLLGLQKPDRGRALLFAADVWKTRARAMARVGVVPEEPDAPPEMSPDALSRFCSRLYPRWDEAAVRERLDRFGVPRKTVFGKLSKGQKGQTLLALALGHGPELLVLDDPTLGLDVVARQEFFAELAAYLADRGTTVFITTHDLAGVERMATHVGILRDGRLVLDEELEALKARFRQIRWGGTADAAALALLEAVGVKTRAWGSEAVATRFDESAFARFRGAPGVADPEAAPISLEAIFTAVCGEEAAVEGGTR